MRLFYEVSAINFVKVGREISNLAALSSKRPSVGLEPLYVTFLWSLESLGPVLSKNVWNSQRQNSKAKKNQSWKSHTKKKKHLRLYMGHLQICNRARFKCFLEVFFMLFSNISISLKYTMSVKTFGGGPKTDKTFVQDCMYYVKIYIKRSAQPWWKKIWKLNWISPDLFLTILDDSEPSPLHLHCVWGLGGPILQP